MEDFEPHLQTVLLRTSDPRKLGGFFNTVETYSTGGDSHVELWERQQGGFHYYYYAWLAFDDVVRVAQFALVGATLLPKFRPAAREGLSVGFIKACRGQYEAGISTIGLWINAGEDRLDRHQLIAANRFEDSAEYPEDLEDAVGIISNPPVASNYEVGVDYAENFDVFANHIETMESLDEENPDTTASDEDDE